METTTTTSIPWDVWSTVISVAATLIGIALSYIFGRLQAREDNKRRSQMERYNGYYVPYIKMLYRMGYPGTKFSSLSQDERREFISLAMKNLSYIDGRTVVAVMPLYEQNSLYEEYLSGRSADGDTAALVNIAFVKLTAGTLAEARLLSQALRLPDITEPIESRVNCTQSAPK